MSAYIKINLIRLNKKSLYYTHKDLYTINKKVI